MYVVYVYHFREIIMTVLENDIAIYSRKEIERLSANANDLLKTPLAQLVEICKKAENQTLNIALKTLNFMASQEEKQRIEIIQNQIAENEKASCAISSKYNRW